VASGLPWLGTFPRKKCNSQLALDGDRLTFHSEEDRRRDRLRKSKTTAWGIVLLAELPKSFGRSASFIAQRKALQRVGAQALDVRPYKRICNHLGALGRCVDRELNSLQLSFLLCSRELDLLDSAWPEAEKIPRSQCGLSALTPAFWCPDKNSGRRSQSFICVSEFPTRFLGSLIAVP